MAKRLTDKQIAELKRKPSRYVIKDPELPGHYVRIPPEGPAVFAAVARTPSRKQVWVTLGTTADLKIGEARERAQKALRRIKDGLPATETKHESVAEVTEGWLKRHVDQKRLRTADEYRRIVDRYILPKWKDRVFVDLRRSDIAALMDMIEDKHGARQADMVLTTLSSIAAWVHKRDDSYTPPFARGMRRVARGGRERVLNDEEIRRIWSVCDRPELYPIGPIDTEPLEKSNAGTLRLPQLALDVLYARGRIGGDDQPYVFPSLHGGPWGVSSKLKARLDKLSGVSGWTLHDFRRTAKTLMARADVRPDISERVLGHQIRGVEAIYDRHRYEQQKADA
jgi:integrase